MYIKDYMFTTAVTFKLLPSSAAKFLIVNIFAMLNFNYYITLLKNNGHECFLSMHINVTSELMTMLNRC